MAHSNSDDKENSNSSKELFISAIPVKKNNLKPTFKKQSNTEVTPPIEGIEKALIKALEGQGDSEAIEERAEETTKKQARYKTDRSKMWQQETKAKVLEPRSRRKSRKSIEDKWSAPAKRDQQIGSNKLLWATFMIVGIMLLIGLGFLFQTFSTNTVAKETQVASQQDLTEETSNTSLKEDIEAITTTIENYFTATTIDDKCKNIYKADDFRSNIESHYKNNGGIKPIGNYTINGIQPILLDSKEYWQASITHSESLKIYYLRKVQDNQFKVDWKADVVFQDNDIESFINTSSKEPTMFRFYLNISEGYNWGFTENEYFSVILSVPDTDIYLWGYLKKGSKAHERFVLLSTERASYSYRNTGGKKEFILKVRFLKDSPPENNQYVLIDDIVASSWVNTKE